MSSATVQELLQTSLGTVLASAEMAELVQSAKERSVSRGTYLFRAGDTSTSLFIVIDGELDVVVGPQTTGESVVATFGPGQLVGELEYMTRSARVASVLATEEAHLLELGAGHLDAMLKENRPAANKLVQSIARSLARRLASVNQRIVQKQPKTAPTEDVMEVGNDDLVNPISETDLDVLDRLWS